MLTGEKIQQLRKEKGLTQKELALKVGVAEITIRQYETLKRTPRPAIVKKIAEVFGIDIFMLMFGKTREAMEEEIFFDSMEEVELVNVRLILKTLGFKLKVVDEIFYKIIIPFDNTVIYADKYDITELEYSTTGYIYKQVKSIADKKRNPTKRDEYKEENNTENKPPSN